MNKAVNRRWTSNVLVNGEKNIQINNCRRSTTQIVQHEPTNKNGVNSGAPEW